MRYLLEVRRGSRWHLSVQRLGEQFVPHKLVEIPTTLDIIYVDLVVRYALQPPEASRKVSCR